MCKSFGKFWNGTALLALAVSPMGVSATLANEPVAEDQIVVVVDDGESDDSDSKKEIGDQAAPKLWIGIALKEIEGDLAAYLKNGEGVLVNRVMPDSPAQKAGIEVGDILLIAGDKKLADPADLLSIIESLKTDGDEPRSLEITLLRNGAKKEVKVTPTKRPNAAAVVRVVEQDEEIADDGKHTKAFSFNFSADEPEHDVKELMQKLREGRVDKEMNIFRFGNPSIVWNSDDDVSNPADVKELTGDIEIKIVRDVDGDKFEVTVTRKDDQPAAIKVKKGDKSTEYSEENLDEMPEEVRDIVQPLLSEKQGRLRTFRIRPGNGEARIEGRVEILGSEGAETRMGELLSKELADKYRAMAHEMAERSRDKAEELAQAARESARQAEESIRGVVGMPKELEELRELVNDLRQEVKQLREQLNRDKVDGEN